MLLSASAAKTPELCACRVAALQNMLVPLCDIPAADQILIMSGKPLDARRQLSAYGLPVCTIPTTMQGSLTCIAPPCDR